MKIAQSSRISFFSILLLTAITVGIGSISVIHSQDVEIAKIDTSINFITVNALDNPNQAVGAALFAIEQASIDATLSLLSRDGSETVINESSLTYLGAPNLSIIEQAVIKPISVIGEVEYRMRAVPLEGGDYILISRSVAGIKENFASNLRYLAIVTIVVDSLAGMLLLLYFRRERRRTDSALLSRMQEFLGDASHELRTPLTVIRGYVEMLSKEQITNPDDKSRAFNRVGSEINRMETLIQDLLLLAELGESGSRSIEKIDLSEILSAYGTDFITLNPERKVEMAVAPSLQITAARDYVARFIQNALANIVRHTSASDPVRISLRKSGRHLILIIEDGGEGLPSQAYGENIRSLNRFDASRSRENGGSGLGMSIMSAVIEKLDGNLSLRKSALGGLAIVAELPSA